jgi:hypothetical protein
MLQKLYRGHRVRLFYKTYWGARGVAAHAVAQWFQRQAAYVMRGTHSATCVFAGSVTLLVVCGAGCAALTRVLHCCARFAMPLARCSDSRVVGDGTDAGPRQKCYRCGDRRNRARVRRALCRALRVCTPRACEHQRNVRLFFVTLRIQERRREIAENSQMWMEEVRERPGQVHRRRRAHCRVPCAGAHGNRRCRGLHTRGHWRVSAGGLQGSPGRPHARQAATCRGANAATSVERARPPFCRRTGA